MTTMMINGERGVAGVRGWGSNLPLPVPLACSFRFFSQWFIPLCATSNSKYAMLQFFSWQILPSSYNHQQRESPLPPSVLQPGLPATFAPPLNIECQLCFILISLQNRRAIFAIFVGMRSASHSRVMFRTPWKKSKNKLRVLQATFWLTFSYNIKKPYTVLQRCCTNRRYMCNLLLWLVLKITFLASD